MPCSVIEEENQGEAHACFRGTEEESPFLGTLSLRCLLQIYPKLLSLGPGRAGHYPSNHMAGHSPATGT